VASYLYAMTRLPQFSKAVSFPLVGDDRQHRHDEPPYRRKISSLFIAKIITAP
jgi:hypothetical protein